MRFDLFAFYAGPDQIMGLASGVATILGIVLMLWNKVLVTCGRIVNWFHPSAAQEPPQDKL